MSKSNKTKITTGLRQLIEQQIIGNPPESTDLASPPAYTARGLPSWTGVANNKYWSVGMTPSDPLEELERLSKMTPEEAKKEIEYKKWICESRRWSVTDL